MSFNGSGTFNINTAGQPVVTGTVISSTVFNALTADLATGLSTCITKDGQTTVSANIPMNSFKFTGLAAGTAATDSARLGQVQAGTATVVTVTGTDTYVGTMSPPLTAYAAGNMFTFVVPNTNTTGCTLNIDSVGAKALTRDGSTALVAGDLVANSEVVVVYDGTRFQVLNSNSKTNFNLSGTLTVAGNTTLSGGTANGVLYLNGSKVATSGSALTYNGTGLGVGVAAAAYPLDVSGQMRMQGGGFLRMTTTGTTALGYLGPYNAILGSGNATDILLYNGASGSVYLSTSGGNAILDSSGNLGLGVTPSAWNSDYRNFAIGTGGEIYGRGGTTEVGIGSNYYRNSAANYIYLTSAAASYQAQVGGVHYWFTAPSGTAGNAISFTQAMTLDSSGNLLVGSASAIAGERFLVYGSVAGFVSRIYNANGSSPQGLAILYNGGTFNTSTNQYLYCSDSALRMEVRGNGGIANYQANDSNLSDRREKTNFAPAKDYLDVICAIPVQTFNYIDQNMEDDPGLTLGVVAQDVEAVAPELIMESNWGTQEEPKMRLSIYQTDLQYALMKCIQELKAQNDDLRARVAQLEAR